MTGFTPRTEIFIGNARYVLNTMLRTIIRDHTEDIIVK